MLHNVSDTADRLAVHSRLTLVQPVGQAAEEAHFVVVEGRDLLLAGDALQDDMGVWIRDATGDDDSGRDHGDDQRVRLLGNERSLEI